MTDVSTIQGISEQLDSGQDLEFGLKLGLGDIVLGVTSNSRELIDKLSDYFTGFLAPPEVSIDVRVVALEAPVQDFDFQFALKQPDPGKTKIKEAFVDFPDGRIIRKQITGMHFLLARQINIAIGPCLENYNQIVNFINNRLIQYELDRGALLAHAAAVAQGDLGLGLAGFSGLGKSTLALHLMSRNLDFVSNDRLLIRRQEGRIVMRGVAKLPRINPGTALNNPHLVGVIPKDEREQFADIDGDEIWNLEHKYDVKIDDCFGCGKFRLTCPMAGLVILNWRRDGSRSEMRRVDLSQRPKLLDAVRKAPGLFYLPRVLTDFSEAAYLDLLRDIPVFEVIGGINFDQAADNCLEVLNRL